MDFLLHMTLYIALAPLLSGVLRKTKAFLACRQGAPVWQPYADLWKLFHRGIVRSTSASWLFDLSAPVVLGGTLVLAAATPLHSREVPLPMHFVLYIYLMALPRFFQTLAGLDTGSAFGGLGASREAAVSAMAEPALLLSMCGLAHLGAADPLNMFLSGLPAETALRHPETILIAGTLFLLLLAENSRIPVDDPATHLELTMIHEAMVLDHSGVDLGMIQLASSVRLAVFSALASGVLFPKALTLPVYLALPAALLRLSLFGVLIGAVEAGTARMKLSRVASFLMVATVLAAIALALQYAG
ncbi:MAG: NADH-quinone oxidoreductase subunit H [Deltaproteobacteria bacterium]|nr:NADH-quinone oxidoreductase subunit H [Deltaproteobacteria bacterium]